MGVQVKTRTVYFAETKRRHYITKAAAIKNEADAIIKRKWPTEKSESDSNGITYDDGWYWRDHMKRADVLLRRMMKIVRTSMTRQPKGDSNGQT